MKADILGEINKRIDYCKNNLEQKKPEEIEKVLVEIEVFIDQYQVEDDIDQRIKNNRRSDVNGLRKIMQKTKSVERKNAYIGQVEMIDFDKCSKWIIKNKKELKNRIESIDLFKDKFPFKENMLRGLDIKKYVIGTGLETFCWYLENGTPGAMGQRSSLDYYLYWSAEDDSYAIRNGVHKGVVSEGEAGRVFDSLKKNIEAMLQLVGENSIHLIDDRRQGKELPKANILQKILFLYYPDMFIGYYSSAYIEKIAAMIGLNIAADVYRSNAIIADRVKEKIIIPKLTPMEKTVGFTIYLWDEWDDYIYQAVGK